MNDDRFDVKGELGSGSMGKVFRVFDRLRGEEVALKMLRASTGKDIFRFKREFRALADLVHPNLITLFELFSVEGDWMFTMELVHGCGFRDRVRPGGELRVDRLEPALIQLADGLTALHAAGKIHRDLKPSNVLVQDDGRVVILDLGLVAEIGADDRTHSEMAIGTPAYMAPEQAADRPLTSATDWYAVGVMLYEALSGRKPFVGDPTSVLGGKQRSDPPPLEELAPDAPTELVRLATMMLARDPESRPTGEDVLAMLGSAPSPWTRRLADQAAPAEPIGRDAELAVLHEALRASRDAAGAVLILGPPRSGKTTLLRAFADSLEGTGTLVLSGRSDPRELTGFRALDQVVDNLATELLHLEAARRAEVIPPGFHLLAKVFPALQRVPEAKRPVLPGELPDHPEELHRRAFAALRELMQRLAARGPVVVLLDDVQWGTGTGARVGLEYFQGPGAPRCLLVFAHDSEDTGSPALHAYDQFQGRLDRITLEPVGAVP